MHETKILALLLVLQTLLTFVNGDVNDTDNGNVIIQQQSKASSLVQNATQDWQQMFNAVAINSFHHVSVHNVNVTCIY
jgi:hypothetical protein